MAYRVLLPSRTVSSTLLRSTASSMRWTQTVARYSGVLRAEGGLIARLWWQMAGSTVLPPTGSCTLSASEKSGVEWWRHLNSTRQFVTASLPNHDPLSAKRVYTLIDTINVCLLIHAHSCWL